MVLAKSVQGSGFRVQGKHIPLEPPTLNLEPKGFTFVELMIAATMMSVLFVGLGSHLQGGLTVWHRATATAERLQQQRVAWERLERDLAHAIVFDKRLAAYGETENKLPLPTFGETTLAFFTVSSSAARQPATVQFVTYACDTRGGATGLWRTSQSVGQARARNPEPVPQLLLPACEALAFQYAYLRLASEELTWESTWPEPDNADEPWRLPRLVEVSIRAGGHEVRRLGAIPIGDFGQTEQPR